MKFDDFRKLQEQSPEFVINQKGKDLMETYNNFVKYLEYFIDSNSIVALISRLDVDNIGNEKYKIAKKIATLTNNGQDPIDGTMFSISDNDPMMTYVDRR